MEVVNDRLEKTAPATLFVLNHPNGVVDPLIMMAVLGRPVTFLSKSTPFGYPTSRWFVKRFGAIPIYRPRDIGCRGGARDQEDMQQRNEKTFAKCRALLGQGRAVALFPEGTSHNEPMMMPMRTGAARIALSTAEKFGWRDLEIMPVGLWYENSTRFRSAMLVAPGVAIKIEAFREEYQRHPRNAVLNLTAHIEEKLQEIVLEAETTELLRAAPYIAAWTEPEGRKPDLPTRQARASVLLEAYKKLREVDPGRLAKIEAAARRYARQLWVFGVKDPWKLEDPRPITGYATRRILILLAWSPLALIGALLSYIPYRLSAYIVRHHFPDNRQKAGSLKMAVGTLLVLAVWIVEAILVGVFIGAPYGIALVILAPICGFCAIRWSEVARKLREVARAHWMRWRRGSLVDYLKMQRRQLARQISEASRDLQAAA